MRPIYFLLASLAIIFGTKTASAASQDKLTKLVSSRHFVSSGNGNSRHLRSDDTEGEEVDEERVNLERLVSMLSKFDETKIDDFFAAQKLDDVVDMKKLDDVLNAKNLDKAINGKKLDDLIDVKKLDDLVDPKQLNALANWDKKDSAAMAKHMTMNLFPKWKNSGVDGDVLKLAMRKTDRFDDGFINQFAARFDIFRTKVV